MDKTLEFNIKYPLLRDQDEKIKDDGGVSIDDGKVSIDDGKVSIDDLKYGKCKICNKRYTYYNYSKHCKTQRHQIYLKIFEKFGNTLFN